jgi:hypothetical protein
MDKAFSTNGEGNKCIYHIGGKSWQLLNMDSASWN